MTIHAARLEALKGGLRKLFRNRIFLLTTAVPTGVAILYFGLIASDVFISESRFVVRSPERQGASPLGLILKGAGFSRAQDDAYTVQDYILSRDALTELDGQLAVKKAYSASSVDVFSRFPGLGWDDSFEAFYLYFQKKVDIVLDPASSIATVTTRAYTPEMAVEMNRQLLEQAEALVNTLNERGRQDMIRFATEEVAAAENKAKIAALALAAYRTAKGVIDPERQSQIPLQQIAKLQDELVAIKTQVAQLEQIAKDNPQLPVLRGRGGLIEREIQAELGRVAGGDRSLAVKAAEFQRLALEKEFSDRMLGSALATLEQARNEAQRKQLYIERIVQPIKPDEAMEPRRLRGILATLMLGFVAWGILTMLIAGVKEHQD